jgi:hypothetical protein
LRALGSYVALFAAAIARFPPAALFFDGEDESATAAKPFSSLALSMRTDEDAAHSSEVDGKQFRCVGVAGGVRLVRPERVENELILRQWARRRRRFGAFGGQKARASAPWAAVVGPLVHRPLKSISAHLSNEIIYEAENTYEFGKRTEWNLVLGACDGDLFLSSSHHRVLLI